MTAQDVTSDDCETAAAPGTPRRGVVRLVSRSAAKAWNNEIFAQSAAAAYWQTLSLPPLLLGVLGSLGYIGGWFGPDTTAIVQQRIVSVTGRVFSHNAVQQIIAPTVSDIMTTGRGELVSIGFVISLWAGSSAMSSFVDAITKAHGQYELRHPVWQRIVALLIYVASLVIGIFSLPMLALGPDRLIGLLPEAWQGWASSLVGWFTYPAIVALLLVALTTLYKVALPEKLPWHRGLPGALLAMVVFLVAATMIRIYITWVTRAGFTYGALAAPIAWLLATFFIGFSIVLGAQFNAAIQEQWPVRPSRRQRRRLRKAAAASP